MRIGRYVVGLVLLLTACDRVGEIEQLAGYDKGAAFVGEGGLHMQVRHFRQVGNDDPDEQVAFAFDADARLSIVQEADVTFDRVETVIGISALNDAAVLYSEVHTSNYDVEASLALETHVNGDSVESTTDLSMDLPDSVAMVQHAGSAESGLIWGATLQGHDPLAAFASFTLLSGAEEGDVWGDFPLEQRGQISSVIDLGLGYGSVGYCDYYETDSLACQLQQLLGATLFGTVFGLNNVYEAGKTEELKIKLDGTNQTIEAQKVSVYFLNSVEADRVQDCFSEAKIKYESDGGVVIGDSTNEPNDKEEGVVNFQCPPVLQSLDLWMHKDLVVQVKGAYSVMAPDQQYVPLSSDGEYQYYENYLVDPGYGWEMFGQCESDYDSTQFDVRLFAFSKTQLKDLEDQYSDYSGLQCDFDKPERYAHYTLTDVELSYTVSQITNEAKDAK